MSLHYIIDGYNLMKQIPQVIGKRPFQRREDFIRFLEIERPQGKNQATVIFDGREDVFLPRMDSEIEVIFSRRETADEKIKKMLEKENPKNLIVISDDNEIKYFAKIRGIKSIGAKEFLSKIKKKRGSVLEEEKMSPDTIQAMEITKKLKRIWLRDESKNKIKD